MVGTQGRCPETRIHCSDHSWLISAGPLGFPGVLRPSPSVTPSNKCCSLTPGCRCCRGGGRSSRGRGRKPLNNGNYFGAKGQEMGSNQEAAAGPPKINVHTSLPCTCCAAPHFACKTSTCAFSVGKSLTFRQLEAAVHATSYGAADATYKPAS